MFKAVVNKLLMVIYFLIGTLILEAITFAVLDLGFMPEFFFMNMSIVLFVAIFVFIIPNYTAQYIVYTIILLVQTIFIYVNYSLHTIYGDLFSIEMIRLVGEAAAAINGSFIYFSVILQLVLVFVSIVVVGAVLLKQVKEIKINTKQHFSVFNVILLASLQCFACGYYVNRRNYINGMSAISDVNYISSETFLMNTSLLKSSSYSNFGTYGYFLNLITNQIYNNDAITKNATINYFNSGNIYDGTYPVYENGTTTKKSNGVFGVDSNGNNGKGNNVIVIMMESLEWLGFGDGTHDPKFNNLSYELTPNVYSLIYGEDYLTDKNNDNLNNDALIAKNFFAKSKTNYSEAFGILGSYPIGQSLAELGGKNYNKELNAFGYSMPSILKEKGYTTSYIHSNVISFYERNKTHGNIGFDHVIGKDNVMKDGKPVYTGNDLLWDHWDSEADFAVSAMDYIIPTNYKEKPFYSFYLTVATHGAYEDNKYKGDVVRYKDYVMYGKDDCIQDAQGNWVVDNTKNKEELTYSTWYQNVYNRFNNKDNKLLNQLLYYQSTVVGLDEAIGKIVEQLKTYGIYEETTLLLYSDHNAYYDALSNKFKNYDINDHSSIGLNTIPMIISSPGLKKYNAINDVKLTVNDRFCSAYDVIPTLFDLLGIKFNENLYIGKSLFSPADYVYNIDGKYNDMMLYYSYTGGVFSKDVYTYDLDNFIKENNKITDAEIELFKAESNKILTRLNYISIMNSYHLYNNLRKI